MNETRTIHDFITANGITMAAEPAKNNPNMADPSPGSAHWLCIISSEHGSRMSVPFSQGSSHRRWRTQGQLTMPSVGLIRQVAPRDIRENFAPVKGFYEKESIDLREYRKACTEPTPPDLASVLDCLRSDASSIDDARSFEDWAANFGYDTDSRKAEKAYRACQDSAQALRHFLGRKAYDALMECEGL